MGEAYTACDNTTMCRNREAVNLTLGCLDMCSVLFVYCVFLSHSWPLNVVCGMFLVNKRGVAGSETTE